MATLSDLARQHTELDRGDIVHLLRLVADWGMLADFCFADVLLYSPDRDGNSRWLVMGHVRPVTGQTLYISDWVGTWANESEIAAARPGLRVGRRWWRARSPWRACPTRPGCSPSRCGARVGSSRC